MSERTVRIGCAAGFWGDTLEGAAQLVRHGGIDYLVFDYLSEITMSLLARMRARKPEAGFVPDFVEAVAPLLPEIAARHIRIVSNAGGVNPSACAKALAQRAAAAGVKLKIGVITGDDLLDRLEEIRAAGVREMFSEAPLPENLMSANAYLGASPIAAALARGADVVITGRCVDSAIALGPLMHEFGWRCDDYDLLAAGSLAGHLIECGAQVTGGLFTDWRAVPRWDDMGFPIVECAPDGSFVVTKPAQSGGIVTTATVAEQMLYEIGDPGGYKLPDVTCDFRHVRTVQEGADRVRVSGARGRTPGRYYKVSATYPDGYRSITTVTIGGFEAAQKARRVGEAILARTSRILRERQLGDYRETSIEVVGAEDTYGAQARPGARASREVVLKLGVRHDHQAALEVFAREIAPAATAMAQGLTGFFAGRPNVQPVVRLFSFLWESARTPITLAIDGNSERLPPVPAGIETPAPKLEPPAPPPSTADCTVPLLRLAWGRSGDKGNNANIGVIAREPEFLPYIRASLTEEAVRNYFSHLVRGKVERFDLPGVGALNFVLHDALGGGGVASLRIDPQGKAFAQMLMDIPIAVPGTLARRLDASTG